MSKLETLAHIYLFNSPHNWRRILAENGPVKRRYWPRLARMQLLGWLTEPIRRRSERMHGEAIARMPIHPQPIFIMGLWRSGTTHLHNLMGLDPALGYASTMQCLAPSLVAGNEAIMRRLFSGILPKHRIFDNVKVNLDSPQEEEAAMANLFPQSYYNYWLFPSRTRLLYEKYMRLRGLAPQEYEEWRWGYLWLLRQTSYLQHGKQLVLKSPTNLTRTRELLAMFPEARFVEIQRNPLRVWLSYQHLQRVLLRMHCIEDLDEAQFFADSLYVFTESMRQWLEEKRLIAPDRLISVKYEDLVANPLQTLQRIYDALGLPTKEVLPRWQDYLAQINGYRTNRLQASARDIEIARQHFGFLYEAGGYSPDW